MTSLVRTILIATLVCASAAASAQSVRLLMSAPEALRRSMEQPEAPLEPTWVLMDVCASGAAGTSGFLNSFHDYRDRRSLNVELPAQIRADLASQYGADPVEFFRGRQVAVYGAVRQVRINLFLRGQPTDRFYFQTQLRLRAAHHLEPIREGDELASADCGALVS